MTLCKTVNTLEGSFSYTELNHSQIIEHIKGVCMVDVDASDKGKMGVSCLEENTDAGGRVTLGHN